MGQERKINIEILRGVPGETPQVQVIPYSYSEENVTVAAALREINEDVACRDIDGNPVPEISWDCGCMQKKCGACAMVINGRPRLACDAFLREFKENVRLEPLKKFPLIKDLRVDRTIMRENLKTMQLWVNDDLTSLSQENERPMSLYRQKLQNAAREQRYEASRCLQCGCCLEVCPNFNPEGDFFGAAAYVPTMRLLSAGNKDLKEKYRRHVFRGCGKSLSCQDICPAGIPTEQLLSRGNRILRQRS